MKIFHRFNLMIIIVIVAIVTAFSVYSISTKKGNLMDEMIEQSIYYSKTIALGINSGSFLMRRDMLVDYLDNIIPQSKGWIKYAMVTSLGNFAWIDTIKEDEYEILNDDISMNVIKNIDAHNPFEQVYYNDRLNEKILDVAFLITVNHQDRGIMRFGFSFANVSKKIQEAILQSVLLGIASVIVGIALSTLLAKQVTRPISKIMERSKAIAHGQLDLAIPTNSNIFEIDELEQSIEQMKRDLKYIYLGGVFADFHHAIKSDLALISANMQYIRQNAGKNERADLISEKAKQVVDRIDYINSEINKYRAYRKPQEVKRESVSVNELLSQVLASIADWRGIELKTDFQKGLSNVFADPTHLKKALGNIIVNAIEAMGEAGTLNIRTESLDNAVVTSISDTGAGIAAADLAKIFQPSFSTKKKRGGEGIGLAISQMIIEDIHGGKIEVESELGRGTRFIIKL